MERRLAAACAAWGRPDLTPVILEGKRIWPVRTIGGRFMLAEQVGRELDDAQLRALVGYQLTRPFGSMLRAWAPYLPTPAAFLFLLVAIPLDLSGNWLALPLGLMLVGVFLLLRPSTYRWAEAARLRAFAAQGGDLGALAAALWKTLVVTGSGSKGMAYGIIAFHGALSAMADLSGCTGEELLERGGVEVIDEDDEEEPLEPEPPKTWWQRYRLWISLAILVGLSALSRWLGE